jgi:transcriptional regulator with XRE-family HTH domain
MEETEVSVGKNIKRLREFKNYTQEYVAEQLQISQTAYSKIERDETDVSFSKLNKIAKILGVNVNDIINTNDEKLWLSITYGQNFDNSNNGIVIKQSISKNEKDLYEKLIEEMREEISFLKETIRNLTTKSF